MFSYAWLIKIRSFSINRGHNLIMLPIQVPRDSSGCVSSLLWCLATNISNDYKSPCHKRNKKKCQRLINDWYNHVIYQKINYMKVDKSISGASIRILVCSCSPFPVMSSLKARSQSWSCIHVRSCRGNTKIKKCNELK